MSRTQPDNRIPEELAGAGWRLSTNCRGLFYMHRPGIKTGNHNQPDTAVEAARRIAAGRMTGIPVSKKPPRKTNGGLPLKIETCRHPQCAVEVIMVRYAKPPHRPAPIEVQPSEDGNILVTGDSYEIVPKAERQRVKDRGFVLRKNHFATCPFAKSFAKTKRAAA